MPIFKKAAFQHVKEMIQQGKIIFDERDVRSDQPTANDENEFIRSDGFDAYANWQSSTCEAETSRWNTNSVTTLQLSS